MKKNEMDKVTLKDIRKDVFRRSTLIAIPNLKNLLALNDEFSPQEVFFGIVKDALQTFEKYFPLYHQSKVYIDADDNKVYKFTDNFEAWLNGGIAEDTISLVPTSILYIGNTTNTVVQKPRRWRYDPPYLREFWLFAQPYWVFCTTNRPIIEDYDSTTGEFTDKCAIYFLTKDLGSMYKVFRDQVYVEFCRYLINIKKNFSLQNLPLEVFQGLEEDYQNVQRENDDIYKMALPAGQNLF